MEIQEQEEQGETTRDLGESFVADGVHEKEVFVLRPEMESAEASNETVKQDGELRMEPGELAMEAWRVLQREPFGV